MDVAIAILLRENEKGGIIWLSFESTARVQAWWDPRHGSSEWPHYDFIDVHTQEVFVFCLFVFFFPKLIVKIFKYPERRGIAKQWDAILCLSYQAVRRHEKW